jgi:aromatic-L-amino-acid decarboxylase
MQLLRGTNVAEVHFSMLDAPSLAANKRSDGMLRLSSEEMRKLGYKVVDVLIEHFEDLPNKPVTRRADRPALDKKLRKPPPMEGNDPEDVLREVQREVFSSMMHVDHPRFFAFIPSPSNFISVMADALAAGFNVFSGTWLEGSGPTEIELVTIDWLRQICGLPDTAGGLFVSGGSMANLTALAVAREIKLRNRIPGAVVYCSDQTHSSIDRGLRVLGFSPTQIRKIPSDKNFRLVMSRLRRAVISDRAKDRNPFCVVANVGTTNSGAVDPLPALADFCSEEGLWLHADGAYGAAAMLCDENRSLLEGLERVDSLILDPHKWLFQPHEMGCVLVRDGRRLGQTFRMVREYTRDVERSEEVNLQDCGIQMTRGFRALKLWMSLRVFGLEAFREGIAQGIASAELAERALRDLAHWEIVTPAQLGILTFRYVVAGRPAAEIDALNLGLVEEMIEDGFAMVSSTVLKGRTVLRMCINNPRTTEADISETVRLLNHYGNKISLDGVAQC